MTKEAVQNHGVRWETAAGPEVPGQGINTPGAPHPGQRPGPSLHTWLLRGCSKLMIKEDWK